MNSLIWSSLKPRSWNLYCKFAGGNSIRASLAVSIRNISLFITDLFRQDFSIVQLWAMCLHWVIFINLVIIQTLFSHFLQQNCWMVLKSNCHQQTKHAGSMGMFCLKWYQMFSSCFPQNMTSYCTVPCFCLLTICICVWVTWCILTIWIMYCSAISWLV